MWVISESRGEIMKPAEVLLYLVVAIITTVTFTLVSYFYRLAIEEISLSSGYTTLYNLLEVTPDRIIFTFLGLFGMLIVCKWMGDHYKPTNGDANVR